MGDRWFEASMFLQCYYSTFHFFSYILPKGPVLGPTLNAGVAQQAEQLMCNQQVDGSIPFASSIEIKINVHFVFPFIFLLMSQRFPLAFAFMCLKLQYYCCIMQKGE